MNHLTEDNLLQYAFGLLDSQQRQEANGHLDQCADCRAQLERIQQQFAVLDVLERDEMPGQDLIQRTMANHTRPARPLPFYRKPWVEWTAAVAVVVLVLTLLLQHLPETRIARPVPEELEQSPVATAKPARQGSDQAVSRTLTTPTAQWVSSFKPSDKAEDLSPKTLHDTLSKAPAATGQTYRFDDFGRPVKIVSDNAVLDTPPFAPASAIELVVLPKPDRTQLTIYNAADLTLVRDTRKLTLKPGWNWLQFMWDGTLIDPTSLSLIPQAHADKIDIQQLVYPAGLQHIGRWLIHSQVEGAVPFEITYFAAGLDWRAFYMGTLNTDETAMQLNGYVNVSNHSGQDFTNAQTRLVIGETHLLEQIPELARRRYPYGPDITTGDRMDLYFAGDEKDGTLLGERPVLGRMFSNRSAGRGGDLGIKKIEKEGLSEYFLYTIEGTEDLPDTWAKRLPSFDADEIPVKSLYKYDEDRYGRQTVRFISFTNDAKHKLGATPIPQGSVKLYRGLNKQQNLSYIGAADMKYIPVNEAVEMNLGPAQRVTVEPVLMDTRTENYTYDGKRNITGWDAVETWRTTVTNTRAIPVDIEITRGFGTDYWHLALAENPGSTTPAYKKHDKNRARFTLTLEPHSKQHFTYTVTRYEGVRREIYLKQKQEPSI